MPACRMLLAMVFDYRQLRNLAWPFFLITVFLLLLVPIAGKTVYGAKRWISLGFMSLQPSEMAKLSVLVLVARLLARDSRPLGWKNFCSVLCVGLIPCGLIIVQPDLGTTLLILLIMLMAPTSLSACTNWPPTSGKRLDRKSVV